MTIVTTARLKAKEHAVTESGPDSGTALSYDKECCKDLGSSARFKQLHVQNVTVTVLRRYLFENILFSHELLSFSVGFVDHDLQNVLSVVGDVHHKEHQILQELGHRSDRTCKRDTHKSITRGCLVSC